MARCPAKLVACKGDVEFVVVVRHRDHEGLDERLVALVYGIGDDFFALLLQPCAYSRDRLRDRFRQPAFTMDEPRKLGLQFLVAQHAALTDQESGSFSEVGTPADGKAD